MFIGDAVYFHELQTQTGWSRTLYGFALWCAPVVGWRTLDVGCGPGLLPAIFSKLGCRAVGVDLDEEMFHPSPLHANVVVANVYDLPFKSHSIDLITASNLLFLLAEPVQALTEMKRLLCPGGKLAMLNPSELLLEKAAQSFADEKNMDGVARETLLNWAKRATEYHRWSEDETRALYDKAGMKYIESILKVGPGFGRFTWGTV